MDNQNHPVFTKDMLPAMAAMVKAGADDSARTILQRHVFPLPGAAQELVPVYVELLRQDKRTDLTGSPDYGMLLPLTTYDPALIVPLLQDSSVTIRSAGVAAVASQPWCRQEMSRKKRAVVPADEVELVQKQIVPLLVKLTHDSDAPVSGAAITTLRNLGDLATEAMGPAAANDPHLREMTLAGLARGGPDAIAKLVVYLEDRDPSVRHEAAMAISNFQRDSTGRFVADNVAARAVAVPALIDMLGDPPFPNEGPGPAFNALEFIGTYAVPGLKEGLKRPDVKVRRKVVEVLGYMAGADAASALRQAMADSDETVRMHAAQALAASGSPAARQALTDAMTDPNPLVRRAAAQTLGTGAPAETSKGLPSLLKDPDPQVRSAAVKALKDGGAAGLNLADAMKDPDPAIRAAGAAAMARSRRPDALAALVGALHDPDPVVREAAGDGLAAICGSEAQNGGIEAIDPLVAALRDKNSFTRAAVADALLRAGPNQLQKHIAVILPLLKDPNASIRRVAAAVAGAGASEEATAALLPLLADTDPRVRAAAAQGVGSDPCAGADALTILARLTLTDADPAVRRAAEDAMLRIGQIANFNSPAPGRSPSLASLPLEQGNALLEREAAASTLADQLNAAKGKMRPWRSAPSAPMPPMQPMAGHQH